MVLEKNGVICYINKGNKFEALYLKVRKKENRLYSDEIVKKLPYIPTSHKYSNEWNQRSFSAQKVLTHINKKFHNNILDFGCGNGWFSNLLALNGKKVSALDINFTELEQGARNFKHDQLQFIYGDIFDQLFEKNSFNIICLNSSIQYFKNFNSLITILLHILKQDGEILIWDSPFYKDNELVKAKERTQMYYGKLGIPEMADYYFHHPFSEIKKFNYKILYKPNRLKMFFKKSNSFFHIISIKK